MKLFDDAGKAAITVALVAAVLATFLAPEPRNATVRKSPFEFVCGGAK